MSPQKPKFYKIILANKLVEELNNHMVDSDQLRAFQDELSRMDVVTSALTLSQQWSIPKEECAPQLHFTGRPCGESCICYTHAIINATLEVLSSGPKALEATLFLEQEYLCNADSPKILH